MFLHLWIWVSFDNNHDTETGKPTAFELPNHDLGGEGESWNGDSREGTYFGIQILQVIEEKHSKNPTSFVVSIGPKSSPLCAAAA